MMTRHYYRCGWEWTLAGPPGRSESCHQCRADLRVCLNCVSYDRKRAHQCRERRAEPVAEKDRANFCEYFDFVGREYTVPVDPRQPAQKSKLSALLGTHPTADEGRDTLKKIFGD